jgi:methionyl-tRNA formyltransferase
VQRWRLVVPVGRPTLTGDADVTVTVHETQSAPDSGDWQEIVEISAHSASGELVDRGIMDDLDEELLVLSFNGSGDHRLGLHTRGRGTAGDVAPPVI